jgi:hypothetical protein
VKEGLLLKSGLMLGLTFGFASDWDWSSWIDQDLAMSFG